jgi:hypothetical protein
MTPKNKAVPREELGQSHVEAILSKGLLVAQIDDGANMRQ